MNGLTLATENLALGRDFVSVTRFCVPLLALWILLRCVRSMLRMRY